MDNNPKATDEHELSEKQTNTEESKLSTAIAAVTDPKFPLPSLTAESSSLRYALSFGTLLALLVGGIGGAMYCGVEILQSSQPLALGAFAVATMIAAFFLTGTIWIDWFELVVGYWWLSIPIGALAGIAVVLNIEASATLAETE